MNWIKVIFAVVFATAAVCGRAETGDEYQKRSFMLDLGMGANFDMSSLDAEQQDYFDKRPGAVTQISMRPAYFFSRHWGAYADLRFNLFLLRKSEKFLDLLLPGLSKLKPSFTMGATYRFERGRWQIHPRLGLGFNCYGGMKSYKKVGDDEVSQKCTGSMFCLDGGISFAYRTSRVCSLFVDVNTMLQLAPAKYTCVSTTGGATTTYAVDSHTWGNTMSISAGIRLQTSLSK